VFSRFEQVDDISKFLPPGFKPEEATEAASTTTTEAAKSSTDKATGGFKLDLSNLFSDDVSSFLPPGYDPEKAPAQETESEDKSGKIQLKFPSRPSSDKKTTTAKPRRRPSGPPPFVPKIKSFGDR